MGNDWLLELWRKLQLISCMPSICVTGQKESENRLQYACVRRMQVTVDDAYRNPSGKCEKRNSQHLANI